MKLDWGCKWNALVLAHQQFIQHSIFENVLYARSANERPAHSTNRYTCIKYKRAQKKEHSLTFGLQNRSRISNEFINSRKKEQKREREKKLNVLFVWLTHAAFVYGIFPAEKCAQRNWQRRQRLSMTVPRFLCDFTAHPSVNLHSLFWNVSSPVVHCGKKNWKVKTSIN